MPEDPFEEEALLSEDLEIELTQDQQSFEDELTLEIDNDTSIGEDIIAEETIDPPYVEYVCPTCNYSVDTEIYICPNCNTEFEE
jgi:rubrerythrin